jgi:hypothetical protein
MKFKKTTISALVTICLFISIYFGIKFYVESSTRKEIDKEISQISSFADIEYEDIRVAMLAQRIHLQRITLKPRYWDGTIHIDELVLHTSNDGKKNPEDIYFKLNGIHLDPAQMGNSIHRYIDEMGFKKIEAQIECSVTYIRQHQELNIKRLLIAAENTGQIVLALRVRNIDPSTVQSPPRNILVALAMMSGVSIVGGEITYKDDSFVGKIYQAEAVRSRQSVQKYIANLTKQMHEKIQDESNPRMQTILRSLRDFLTTPDRITISAAPEQPVPLLTLYWKKDVKKIIELLEITVQTNE